MLYEIPYTHMGMEKALYFNNSLAGTLRSWEPWRLPLDARHHPRHCVPKTYFFVFACWARMVEGFVSLLRFFTRRLPLPHVIRLVSNCIPLSPPSPSPSPVTTFQPHLLSFALLLHLRGSTAGHGRWDRFLPKILHLIAKPEELATQRAASLNGAWDLENDCRIGSVTRFAASTDPRVVRGGWGWLDGKWSPPSTLMCACLEPCNRC